MKLPSCFIGDSFALLDSFFLIITIAAIIAIVRKSAQPTAIPINAVFGFSSPVILIVVGEVLGELYTVLGSKGGLNI